MIRARTVALAWACALVLTACALLLWGMGGNRPPGAQRARVLAIAIAPAEATGISMRVGDGAGLKWVREGAGWMQVEPFRCRVEGAPVERLLRAALELEADAPDANADAAALRASSRLEPPVATVEIHAGDRTVALLLGRRLPGGRAWVAPGDVPGALPRVADGTLHAAVLEGDPRQWRDPRLFTRADVDADAVVAEVRGRDGVPRRIELSRRGPAWRLVAPIETRADRAAVERWLEALARARSVGIVTDGGSPAAFGFDPPFAVAEVRATRRLPAGDGVREEVIVERVELGGPVRPGAEERYARVEGRPDIVELDAASAASFVPLPAGLVEGTACGVRASDVQAIEVTPVEGVAWRADRDGAGWRVAALPQAGAAAPPASVAPELLDARSVDPLLSLLCDGRASDVALRAAPDELTRARIRLIGFDGREAAAVRVSREPEGGRWAFDDGSGVLRIWPASASVPLEMPRPAPPMRLP